MRIWARQFKDTHMLKDELIVDESSETRTHKVFHAIEEVCKKWIWHSRSGWIAI